MGNSAISDLKTKLGLGARANKYKVTLVAKGGGPEDDMVDIFAKTASIPARSINDIEVWNQGRLTTIAGGADFSGTWSVTFMDTEEHTLRGKFLKWMDYIDSHEKHSRGATDHSAYMGTATLEQLSTKDNTTKAKYKFDGIWPKSISDSSLGDSTDELIEFTVEFNYDSWEKTK
jgi:hypothetical protein